ncbi:hypothetical protein [Oscillatoria salina]|uniref:hypothetical protein n=1 Tax=Oscillatoria salina TaxID=331517 RepID=UPI0013B9FF8D|nr:hypothetical protein [Oscillatoria salina]MBZ8179030.1 hypothetical protein [Oscillatoria salina IIICB1]NET88483.1 hypothetical protein [Kamptonema sp. SIO1D9]
MILLSSHHRATFLLAVSLAFAIAGCSEFNSFWDSLRSQLSFSSIDTPTPTPTATPEVVPTLETEADKEIAAIYERAQGAAYVATFSAESAQTPEEWQFISELWQEAIATLQTIPPDSPYYDAAQEQILQYQANLKSAQEKANLSNPNLIIPDPSSDNTTFTPLPDFSQPEGD